ncbi:MAG: WecB/TagA/CpsF family glycosyltransferase [Candidatus Kerfeldbacteria bacterium]|nr:WecB/TagA/CpsF family glycosyltransferase [Candidatus Kerfeldbacteria bacterium]
METDLIEAIDILGVRVHKVTMAAALRRCTDFLASGGQHQIVTVNPEFIMEAQKNAGFRLVLNRAALAVPDGIGLVAAARLAGLTLETRVAGVDLIDGLLHSAAKHGSRVFLFGAADGVAARAADILRRRIPGLRIIAAENERDERGRLRQDAEIIARIAAAHPDILLVAFGAPRQDLWIAENLRRLPSVKIAIGAGGTLDYFAEVLPRAPRLLRAIGLEWLWRLALQPSRWQRIVTATIRFPWAVLTTPQSVHPHEL